VPRSICPSGRIWVKAWRVRHQNASYRRLTAVVLGVDAPTLTHELRTVHAMTASQQVVDAMHALAASSAVYASNPIERDVHTAATHVAMRARQACVTGGQLLLVLEPPRLFPAPTPELSPFGRRTLGLRSRHARKVNGVFPNPQPSSEKNSSLEPLFKERRRRRRLRRFAYFTTQQGGLTLSTRLPGGPYPSTEVGHSALSKAGWPLAARAPRDCHEIERHKRASGVAHGTRTSLPLDAVLSSSSWACRASASGRLSVTTGWIFSSRSSSSSARKSSRNHAAARRPRGWRR